MHGSPCQDFSLAGKQAGGDKDSGTRSSLMYETIRIVEKLKPKYVIWENVKNLLSKKHIHNFNSYLETMEQLGYKNYYQVLNAKDYGIPQNRERIFTISIRKDINKVFTFPQSQELKLKLKDMLDDEVDEKYYLKDEINDSIDENFIKVRNATKKGYAEAKEGDSVNLAYPDSKTRRCRVGNQVSQTLQTSDNMGVVVGKKVIRMEDNGKELIKVLDDLCKRLQDDYNDGLEFEQYEEDRLCVYNVIEILETLREAIEFERNTYPCNDTLDLFLEILDCKHLGKDWQEIKNGVEYE